MLNVLIIVLPIIFITIFIYLNRGDYISLLKINIIELINLALSIQNIESNLEIFIDKNNIEIYIFNHKIEKTTILSYNQYVFLDYIKELEELNEIWEKYRDKNIINNNDIRCPFIIAYRIREMLNCIYDEDDIWLSNEEKACLKYNKNLLDLVDIKNESDSD